MREIFCEESRQGVDFFDVVVGKLFGKQNKKKKSLAHQRRRSGRLKLTTSKENVYEFNEKCALTKNMHLASIIFHTDTNNSDKDH